MRPRRHRRPLEERRARMFRRQHGGAARLAPAQLLEQVRGLRQRALMIEDTGDRDHARGHEPDQHAR